jgi:electron transfer flavoprotein beta subunit
LKILVTVKLVPDTKDDKRIDPASKRLVRSGVDTVLNPFDEYAIEAALQLRDALGDGSTVTVFSMTPESGREVLRKALAIGADDAVMLSDPGLAGSDLWATAYAMAHAIKAVGFDLVLTGTQSTDAISGDLPGMLAEYLGVPALTYAREVAVADGRLRVKRETETGYQTVSASLPTARVNARSTRASVRISFFFAPMMPLSEG